MSAKEIVLAAAGVGGAGQSDPYFEYNTLLLTGDGTNGAQNNTFVDSSSNNFTITRNGNTTQGTFSPYGDLWSNYFDGSSYFTIPDNAAFNLGNSNFTIECWAYFTSAQALQCCVGQIQSSSDNRSFLLCVSGSKPYFEVRSGTTAYAVTGVSNFVQNVWTHLAAVRNGNTLTLYQNGTSLGTVDVTGVTVNNSTNLVGVGCGGGYTDPAGLMNGYISNCRVVVGTAIYTSTFTPPTAPLTAVSGTALLTCQSNRFIDNSSNNFTLTVNGTPSVQRFSPFNPTAPYSASTIGGSGYFNGTTDYLSVAANTILNIGSGNFTVEGWFNTSAPSASAGIVGAWNNNLFNIQLSASKLTFAWAPFSTSVAPIIGTTIIRANTWYHFAAVRNGNTFTLYLNGVSEGSFSTATTAASMTTPLITGAVTVDDSVIRYFTGNISNIRVVKGTAVYTSNFTPPSAPLTAITNTSLLCNFTNAGIPDAAMQNDLETVGNAQVSTSVKKYGTGSLYFDGTGDWLTVSSPTAPNILNIGESGNFTIEFWLYVPDATFELYEDIITWRTASATNTGILLNNGVLTAWLMAGSGVSLTDTTGALSATTWYHVAVVRNNGTLTIYKNGTSVASAASTVNVTPNTSVYPISIGKWVASTGENLSGYIDDLRITKGLARYTANFTPPAQALPTY